MKKILSLVIILSAFSQITKAQQGFGTSNPAPSSVIDMVATNKGVLMPRVALTSLTVAAPVSSPANALTVFNTATAGVPPNNVTPGYYYWSQADLKWVRLSSSADEPWNVQATSNKATANTDNIYQQGKVAVGFTVADAVTTKQMEVKGDFKSSLTSTTTGNTMAFEVNSPLGTEATGGYWMTPTNRIHAFVADNQNVRAVALDNLAAPTKASNFEVGLDAVNIYSKHPDNAKQATLELNASNAQFAMYANQYSTNVGSMVKSDGANGLLLYHGGSSASTAVVDGNDRTQLTIKKAEGVTFSHFGPTSLLTGIYTFPTTSGTNGQVMVKGAGNAISWANPSTLATNNIYTANGSITTGAGTRTVTLNGNNLHFVGANQTTQMSANSIIQKGTVNAGTIVASSADANSNGRVSNLYLQAFDDNATQVFAGEGATSLTLGTHFTAVPSPIVFTTNQVASTGSTEKMRLTPNGELAINSTTAPTITVGATTVQPKLYVNGDVSTSGKYYTSNSVYADYVFEKYFKGSSELNPSYEFKSLNYVKDFIKKNHHLPGVESIRDLDKHENGYTFDMTKLTVQSLEKIEELYLHTIEQRDKIDAQQAEIEKLKKEAEETKKRLEKLEKLLVNDNN